jgi:long-chain acyl-CoA synthetase
MLGYYKNEEATHQAIDKDGWYHTGDLGTMNEKQNIFIRGRIKNMLLGASGQNVYPEEIEDKLNSMPMVSESLVVQDHDKLVALVYPDQDEVVNFSQEELEAVMDQNRENLNAQLPAMVALAASPCVKRSSRRLLRRALSVIYTKHKINLRYGNNTEF